MRIKRDFIFDPSLVLYLPLYKLDSASFMSKDVYGHLCTVTGALWRLGGRYFDGTDDYINVPDHDALDFGTGSFSVCAWFNIDTTKTGTGLIIDAGGYNTGFYVAWSSSRQFYIKLDDGTNDYYRNGSAPTSADGLWHFGAIVVTDRTSVDNYLDGAHNNGGTSGILASVGTITNANDKLIGRRLGYDLDLWKGLIGELLIFNRPITPSEYQNIYMSTKWRYR
jgi:hypothetical protein